MTHPFQINPELTAISLAYTNKGLIAEQALPRVEVKTESFKYNYYPKAQMFTVPDTRIGRKGEANEVELKSEPKPASVEAHALKDFVPQADIDAAQNAGQVDPVSKNTIFTTDLLALSREKRAATVLQNSANFGYSETLTGTDKISDAASDVIDIIQTAIDNCFYAPTHMILNRQVASKLSRHADIVKTFHGNSGDKGIVPLRFIADLFGLKDILVGEALINTNKKGQKEVLSGVWGNDISIYYQNPLAEVEYGLTFGITAEYEKRQVYTYFNNDRGVKGGQVIKVVEQLQDLILAPECGAILKDVI